MRSLIRTVLPAPADRVWEAVLRPETLELVTRGLLGFSGAGFPERWGNGVSIAPRLVLFHVVPAWKHHLTVTLVDDAARVLETREGGGPIDTWIIESVSSPGMRRHASTPTRSTSPPAC